MESEAKQYSSILELVSKQLETARQELKDIQFMQERWAAAEQGFYYEREPAPDPLDPNATEVEAPVTDEDTKKAE
jgi:hypothetical protein